MRCPTIAISTLTVLSLSVTASHAEEVFNPPRSLQEVPNPGRIIISPPPKKGTVQGVPPAASESGSPLFTPTDFLTEPKLPTQAEVAATPIKSGIPGVYTLSDLGYALPKLVSNLDIDPTIDSLAASLGGVVAVGVRSAPSRCPFSLAALPATLDQIVQGLSHPTPSCPAATPPAAPRPDIVNP